MRLKDNLRGENRDPSALSHNKVLGKIKSPKSYNDNVPHLLNRQDRRNVYVVIVTIK